MADVKIPKIANYLLVRGQYGGSLSLAFKDASTGEIRVFGDVRLPSDYEQPYSAKESPTAAEARSKANADKNHAFGEMVVKHLNAGINVGAMADRMTSRNMRKTG